MLAPVDFSESPADFRKEHLRQQDFLSTLYELHFI